jgi:hypothetical protein
MVLPPFAGANSLSFNCWFFLSLRALHGRSAHAPGNSQWGDDPLDLDHLPLSGKAPPYVCLALAGRTPAEPLSNACFINIDDSASLYRRNAKLKGRI